MSTQFKSPSISAFSFLVGCLCLTACRSVEESAEATKSLEPSTGTFEFDTRQTAVAEEEPEKDAEKEAEQAAEKAFKIKQSEHKLQIAQLEVEVARISADAALRKAEQDLETARNELEEQRRELDYFKTVTMPVQLEQAQISHDRSTHRADESLDELRELESMYASEEFAEMTKELVLKRGRRQLELAKRSLAVNAMNLAGLKDKELPKKQRAIELKLLEAERKLARAEVTLEKARLENRVSTMKSKQKIVDAEKAVKDAKKDKPAKKEGGK